VVRLDLEPDGRIELTSRPLPDSGAMRVAISNRRVRSDNPFLYHKTTLRELYEGELARLSSTHCCDEVFFLNERDEVCEGSRTNVFVQPETGAALLTPAQECGLLPGTLRARLLAEGRAREAVLHVDDLTSAHKVFVGNSVRGLAQAIIVAGPSSVPPPPHSPFTAHGQVLGSNHKFTKKLLRSPLTHSTRSAAAEGWVLPARYGI
jgi:branched-subunit amino acid aminotransferase/4-amino-4-deoxychorismate lyase